MKQPNSNHCFVCGRNNPYGLHLKFYESSPGEVIVEYTVPEQFQGYPGVVHGGVVAAILDEVTGRTQMGGDPPVLCLQPGWIFVIVKMFQLGNR